MVVIVLAALAAGAIIVAVLGRRALAAQRRATAAAVASARRAEEEAAGHAGAAATAAEAVRSAEAASAAATAEVEQVRGQAALYDANVLWSLEQRRADRTWRVSVAPSPEVPSGLAEAAHPLVAALQIEVAAVREEVGTVVELDAEMPDDIAPATALLTLRAAQELLASVARRAEETVLRVRTEDGDVRITVEATDENGERVAIDPLGLPASARLEQTEDGALVRGSA